MIIPGGLGQSPYLLDLLEKRYGESSPDNLMIYGPQSDILGANLPVSLGALYRFTVIEPRGLPSKDAFGISQVEEFDPKVHQDATTPSARPHRAVKIPATNQHIVDQDPYDKQVVNVYDRWLPILEKGKAKEPGKPIISEKWQPVYLKVGQTAIEKQIYWTESDIHEHESILKTGRRLSDAGAELRDDIEKWGEPVVFELGNLKRRGYELIQTDAGKEFEIHYLLKVTCNGANVSISLQMARHGSDLYENGRFCLEKAKKVRVTKENTHEIVAATRNPFPRTAPV